MAGPDVAPGVLVLQDVFTSAPPETTEARWRLNGCSMDGRVQQTHEREGWKTKGRNTDSRFMGLVFVWFNVLLI